MKEKNSQHIILHPEKWYISKMKTQSSSDLEKLKEFITSRPALQESLKGVLWAEEKQYQM